MMLQLLQTLFIGDGETAVTGLSFAFTGPLDTRSALLALVTAMAGTAWFMWRKLSRLHLKHRVILTLLRTVVAGLALFLLLDPALLGHRILPGEQVVALLFDDSRSMTIPDSEGVSRGERLKQAYQRAGQSFESDLKAKFRVARFAAGATAIHTDSVHELTFAQPTSDLVGSIGAAYRDLAGATVAAVVLFSDGVQQPAGRFASDAFTSLGVPVHTVGLEAADAWRDLELARLSVKRSNLDKTPISVSATIESAGLGDEQALVEILDGDGAVAASQNISIPADGSQQEIRLEWTPVKRDWLAYKARVRHADADPVTGWLPEKDRIAQNDARTFIVDNREKEYRVLYLTGSPTWENKFYRRALEEDRQIKVTSLVRISRAEKTFFFRGNQSSLVNPLFQGTETGLAVQPRYDEAVFLRLGPGGSTLTTGYPSLPEDLYPFHMVIWGDIEHNFFSTDQLELTRSFVLKRGGSLLLLGGPRSFAEGGFGNTLIDEMLPVVLRAVRPGVSDAVSTLPFSITPTSEGLLSGAWLLDPAPERNRELWSTLPVLYGLNAFSLTRAGAGVMATAWAPDTDQDSQPFFSVQDYGEGRCAVMATGQLWPIHMHSPDGNDSFGRLWRQVTRTLVDGVPEPVVLRGKADEYPVNEPVNLAFLVRDSQFVPRDGLRVEVRLTRPDGAAENLDVEESLREVGVYAAHFTPGVDGVHTLRLVATDASGSEVGALEEKLSVVPDLREFRNAQADSGFLRSVAQMTGGRHVDLANFGELLGHITPRPVKAPDTELHRWPLWHWPPFLVLFLLLLLSEWFLRRRRGQP